MTAQILFRAAELLSSRTFASIVLFAFFAFSQNGRADNKYWQNSSSGSWYVAGNWSGGTLPIAGDDVYIDTGGTALFAPGGPVYSPTLNDLYVGYGNSGHLVVSVPSNDHARMVNETSYIGYSGDAEGSVTLNRSNGRWSSSQFYIGYYGKGSVSVSAGAKVFGTSGATSYFGYSNGALGEIIVSGAGSRWEQTGASVHVGEYGIGSVSLSEGGSFEAGSVVLGKYAGASGIVQLDGANSRFTSSSIMTVGEGGSGTLTLSQEAVLEANGMVLGKHIEALGAIEVTGSNTQLRTSFITVGENGNGRVNISQGASIVTSYVSAGLENTATGSIAISGVGSHLESSSLSIGEQGVGNLEVLNGGKLTSMSGIRIGSGINTNGRMVVSGIGSQIDSQNTDVGIYGNASIEILDGGVMRAGPTMLGSQAGSYGTVVVSGSQSKWEGALSPFRIGEGSLTLASGGEVSVGEIVVAEYDGLAGAINFGNYDGDTTTGRLSATGISFGLGAGTVNFNQTDSLIFTTNLSGIGTVVQRGTGTTTISANLSYSGQTLVSQGTLLINGALGSLENTVEVHENGTLGGIGTIAGHTSVSGTLAPGNGGVGELYVANDLNIDGDAFVVMEIAYPGYNDRLVVGRTLTIADGVTLKVQLLGSHVLYEGYEFLLFSGGSFSFGTLQFDLPNLNDGLFWDTSSLSATGSISVVPEPASVTLCLLGLVGLWFVRCRRFIHEYPYRKHARQEILLR